MDTKRKKAKNYLSLDGGPSALSALAIVEEMSSRLQSDFESKEESLPCQMFDVITGSGNGGLGAILLGRMERSPSQAIEAYAKLTLALSVEPAKDDEERRRNTARFETAFTEVLNDAGFKPDALMLDPNAPKTVVYTTNVVNLTVPYPIRSYCSRGTPAPPITILQAACACVASQDRFVPVVVGKDRQKLKLVDAAIACCNPAKELLHEALQVCGEESDVATVLSVGAGMAPVSSSDIKAWVSHSWSRGFASCEQVHEDLQRRLHSTGIYFRLNVEKELAGLSDVILGHTSVYLQEHATSSKLNEAIKSLYKRPEGVKLKDINSLAVVEVTLKPRPSLVPDFIGREGVLEAMHQTHFTERSSQHHIPPITVLSGLGGSGKTQIALRFALDFEEKYSNTPVYFLDARSEEKLKGGLETVVRSLGVEHRSSTYEDALIHLAVKLKKWLIIMDNADDPSLSLFQFIPRSAHGNIVITTRNSTHSALAPNGAHHIEGLSRAESITLLLTASGYKNTEANQALAGPIVDELGCLPLALAHAGAYIRIQKCLSTHLDMYRHRKEEFLRSEHPELPHDYNISVAMTIWISLSRLTPRARDLITLLSQLDVTSIAYEIIEKAAERRFRHLVGTDESEMKPGTLEHADALMKVFCPGGEWITADFDKLVIELLHYSLLRLTTQDNSKSYSMHVLVQSYLQAESRLVQHQNPSLLIVRLLGSSITLGKPYEYLAFNLLLAPQLKAIGVEDVLEVGDHLGFGEVLAETGDIIPSLAHREECAQLWKSFKGDDHKDTVEAMLRLAASYSAVGRIQDALDLREEVLKVRKRLLGPEHLDTLTAIGQLSVSYNAVGRNQDALDLQEVVLKLRRRLLGPEHPHTLRIMGTLAWSYSAVGRNQDALDLREKVLKLQKRLLGPEHLVTLQSMGNIALSYKAVGRNQDALDLEEEVLLKLRKRLMGPEHPDTLWIKGNIAVSYREVGRNQEALDLQEEVLKLRKSLMGLEHPDTLWMMGSLAWSYSAVGRNKDALDLRKKVLKLRKKLLGPEHPDTLWIMGSLAFSYRDMGSNQDALNLEEELLKLQTRLLGPAHPSTVNSMWNLLTSLQQLDMHPRMLELLQIAIPVHEEVFGANHERVVRLKNMLATLNGRGTKGGLFFTRLLNWLGIY